MKTLILLLILLSMPYGLKAGEDTTRAYSCRDTVVQRGE